jgi:tetratricopeptide (TPR) repeat protein
MHSTQDYIENLPKDLLRSVEVLSVTTVLTDSLAKELMDRIGVKNSALLINELKTLPIWFRKSKNNWSLIDKLRVPLTQRLNGNAENIKLQVIEAYKTNLERNQSINADKRELEIQIARLESNTELKRKDGIDSFRRIFNSAELFNNVQTGKRISEFIKESFDSIEFDPKKNYLTSGYYMLGLSAYRTNSKEAAIKYLTLVWKHHDPGSIQSQKDAGKAAYILGLIYSKRRSNWDKAEEAFKDGIRLELKTENISGVAQGYHSLGNLYSKNKDLFKKAEESYLQSIEYEKRAHNDQGLSQVYHSLGNLYKRDNSRKIEAELAYRQSLELRGNDVVGIAQTFHSVGTLYSKWNGRSDEAIQAFLKSIEVHKQLGNYTGLGMVYHSLANHYTHVREYEKAQESYLKSIEVEKSHDHDKHSIAHVYHSYANLLSNKLHKLSEAEVFYNRSIELRRELKDEGNLAISLFSYGKHLAKAGNKEKAITVLQEALKLERGSKYKFRIQKELDRVMK